MKGAADALRAQREERYGKAGAAKPKPATNRNAPTNRNACLRCGTAVEQSEGRGRTREYCSPACKQAAYRRRA